MCPPSASWKSSAFPRPGRPTPTATNCCTTGLASYWVLEPRPTSEQALPPIVAYGGYWLMGDEVHIVTVATHPHFRRQGLSEGLMRR